MKTYRIVFVLLFLFQFNTYSQVGIGTIDPHVSSILEMESTTQGVLTPRMTTLQKNAIATAVEGLLVFDTDEDAFYYFDSSAWVKLEGSVTRDNYKLVKSIADLSDELVGGKYVLNEDYVYEINGTITFDYPIDLNGANMIGEDTGEDILINGTGGALFSGATGGRLKDLLIRGNGQQVFDITGTGSENVIGYSIVITGASSIGTLSDLGVVFFSVLQMVGSDDGLSVSNINSFFVQSIFWTSNTGTCLTLSGSFGNLQIANGRIVVESGDTGIDVSADPTITISASLTGVNISGAGDRVNGYVGNTYPGYNFTNDWDVDCPGIPVETDSNAVGDANLNFSSGTGQNTTFSGNSVANKIQGTTVSNNLFRFSRDGNNRLVYEGKQKRYFTVTSSVSFQGVAPQSDGDTYVFYVAKGDSGDTVATPVLETGTARQLGSNTDIGAVAVVGTVELSPGDFIEIWVENYFQDDTLYIASINTVIR
ncbi:cell wall anchor protein [Algibacter miyuki]|uniref:Cell wall anchor protein n=1 Tax=Algibacter miyuki TaxID=1306933 RepID=A0ABV5H0P0_9FLAO|nr:cell wall anchor protein [Algibacter miyuki]MDN3664138.1 cell wall anchor protein [Algibacter miyuki]